MMNNNNTSRTCLLSDDILANILARLPVKSLVRFISTCKSWCNLIKDDPSFSDMLSKFVAKGYLVHKVLCISLCDETFADYDQLRIPCQIPYEILGSHDGLLCVTVDDPPFCTRPLCLWNPSIRKAKPIPPAPSGLEKGLFVSFGFGFCQKSKDYKVVKITGNMLDLFKVEVYSLAGDSWKQIRPHNVPVGWWWRPHHHTFVNGQSHWIAEEVEQHLRGSYAVMSFNFDDGKIGIVMLPNHNYSKLETLLGTFKGLLSLFLCSGLRHLDEQCCEIWVLKEHGIESSWTKLFSVTQSAILISPFSFGYNGEVFANCDGQLVAYDHNTEEVKKFGMYFLVNVVPYAQSLILLNEQDHRHCLPQWFID